MKFDSTVKRILDRYYSINEQSDKPNWLYQPLKRLARERDDANFNSYWGDWNQNVAPKLADITNNGQKSPTALPQTAGNIPSPLDNYSREEINQINSDPKRLIQPMDAEILKKENEPVISNILAITKRRYPGFPQEYLDSIKNDLNKVVDDYTQNMLKKSQDSVQYSKETGDPPLYAKYLNRFRNELKGIMKDRESAIDYNVNNFMKQLGQSNAPSQQQQSYTANNTGSSTPKTVGYATKQSAPDAIAQHAKTGKWNQQPVMTAKKY